MIEVKGKFNTAVCFVDELEPSARQQIQTVCDRPEFGDSKIRIMPDVHAGMGCTIGTTMTITDKIVPGMVGVDIGCGMETINIGLDKVDYSYFDQVIRRDIPSGRDIRRTFHEYNDLINLNNLYCAKKVDLDRARRSIGTLGGGNHFIEIDVDDQGTYYLIVHSGSRHIGNQVARYYQDQAARQVKAHNKPDIPRDLTYLTDELFDAYMHDMELIQQYAVLNRKAMVDVLMRKMKFENKDSFTTIHNYIDTNSMILRKGAVSAKKGERLLIPINMRDGCLICVGKGNPDWNYSAPHGAGRVLSRTAAKQSLTMEKYKKSMSDVFTTSVNRDTLDEAPMAYKDMESIIKHIGPAVEIEKRIRSVYNFKAKE